MGCASVLNTHSSRWMTSESQNMRYMYLSVSARKKDCIVSSCPGGVTRTSFTPAQPVSVLYHFSIDRKMFHAHSRYVSSPVLRHM